MTRGLRTPEAPIVPPAALPAVSPAEIDAAVETEKRRIYIEEQAKLQLKEEHEETKRLRRHARQDLADKREAVRDAERQEAKQAEMDEMIGRMGTKEFKQYEQRLKNGGYVTPEIQSAIDRRNRSGAPSSYEKHTRKAGDSSVNDAIKKLRENGIEVNVSEDTLRQIGGEDSEVPTDMETENALSEA